MQFMVFLEIAENIMWGNLTWLLSDNWKIGLVYIASVFPLTNESKKMNRHSYFKKIEHSFIFWKFKKLPNFSNEKPTPSFSINYQHRFTYKKNYMFGKSGHILQEFPSPVFVGFHQSTHTQTQPYFRTTPASTIITLILYTIHKMDKNKKS